MKKISHKERIEASKASIKKTKKLESKRMDPKVRKGLGISTGVLATGGIIAGATVGIMAAANTSALATYPTDPKALTAQDFVAGNAAEKPHFDIETSGTQKIINATEGPVKFISNYSALFDEEKMGDFTDWFYHDVSWGPEIGALSSINFLSGVQSDNGKTTLGYHTTSREGSTIIMSPDVPFDWNKSTHENQSIAFYMIKNLFSQYIDGSGLDLDSFLGGVFPGYTYNDHEQRYVTLANNKVFQNTFLKLFNSSYSSQITFLYDNGKLASDSNGVLIIDPNELTSPTAAVYKGIFGIETARASLQNIEFALNNNPTDAIKKKYQGIRQYLVQSIFPDAVTNSTQLQVFSDFLSSSNAFLSNISNKNGFSLSQSNGTSASDASYNALLSKVLPLRNQIVIGSEFHLRTQGSLLAYETKEEKVEKALNDLLVTSAIADKTNKEDKIGAMLSVFNFFYSFNGVMSKTLEGHFKDYGNTSLQATYAKLEKMSMTDIDALDGEWIYSQIYSTEQVGEYTPDDIAKLKTNFENFSDLDMTQLSQDMDKRIHPGKTIAGKRTPGLPIYKSASEREDGMADSFYDSITRRISQDMLYTISHEYGHHTTMWYAQDISTMDGAETIHKNDDPTGTEDSSGVVPNSQVITLPGLDSYADAGKYYLYRSVFKSKSYQEVLDKTTDGDSKTDMTHQSFKTDFTMAKKIIPVDSNEDGIEGFTLLATAFDPLFLGETSTEKFGAVLEGNGLALKLLQSIVKDGEPAIDASKTIKEKDVDFYNLLKGLSNDDKTITTDDQFKNFAKTEIVQSLADSGYFGNDVSAYKSGFQHDENGNQYFIGTDGKLTTVKTDADGNALQPYVGNPDMETKGGTFGFYLMTSLVTSESEEVKTAFRHVLDALTTAADDTTKVSTVADVLSTISVKDIEIVISKLNDAITKYSNVPKLTSNPTPFIDSLTLYDMKDGDETKPLSNIATVLSPYIDKWSLATAPAADPVFNEKGTTDFESKVYARAKGYLDKLNLDSPFKLRNITGEMVLRSYYEITGETTYSTFETLFDDSDVSTIKDSTGKVMNLNDFAPSIEEKIALFTPLISDVVATGSSTDTFTKFVTALNGEFKVNINHKDYTVTLSSSIKRLIADTFKEGGSVFTFRNGVSGVAAVAYVFTHDKDVEKYKHHFTTVTTGSLPPESFYRYTSTYVEGLTRSWNQLAFAVNPELLTKPGEFYDGDPARFASEGEKFYNLQSPDGVTSADEKISQEGNDLREMYKKYYNTDKTISSMLRDRATGLYTFLGYTDKGAAHIDGLVFTKPNTDGKYHQTDFISEIDTIYNVDNYHIYTTHGDASTWEDFTDRESYMTKFSVLGDFENSKLKQGSYYVWKWIDKNSDGIIQENEITAVKNNEIEHNGNMNNNGKSKDTAEIIGNPEDKPADANFEIKVGDIKV